VYSTPTIIVIADQSSMISHRGVHPAPTIIAIAHPSKDNSRQDPFNIAMSEKSPVQIPLKGLEFCTQSSFWIILSFVCAIVSPPRSVVPFPNDP
jgi:hypothetical protein